MPPRHGSSKLQRRWREKWAKRIPFWSIQLMEWHFYGSLAASSNAIEITKKGARGGKSLTQNRTTRLHQNLAHENNKKCHSMIDQKKKVPTVQPKKKKTKPIMTVSQATFIAFATLRMFNVGTTKGKQAHTAEETTRSYSDANHTRDKVRWC